MLAAAFPVQALLKRFFAAASVTQQKGGFLGMMQRVFENLCHDLIDRAAHIDGEFGVVQSNLPISKRIGDRLFTFYYSDQSFTCQPFLDQSKGSMII